MRTSSIVFLLNLEILLSSHFSAILWVLEETRVPSENRRLTPSHWQFTHPRFEIWTPPPKLTIPNFGTQLINPGPRHIRTKNLSSNYFVRNTPFHQSWGSKDSRPKNVRNYNSTMADWYHSIFWWLLFHRCRRLANGTLSLRLASYHSSWVLQATDQFLVNHLYSMCFRLHV